MVSHPWRRFVLLICSGAPAATLLLALAIFLGTMAAGEVRPAAPVAAARTGDAVAAGYCDAPGAAIPDGNGVSLVSQLYLTRPLRLSQLTVQLSSSHPWPGDLSFALTHRESGLSVTLLDRPGVPAESSAGCGTPDLDLVLDDSADHAVEEACAYTPPGIGGRLRPEEPLATFVDAGTLLAGTWELAVRDHQAGAAGHLDRWCLVVTGTVPPVASLAPAQITSLQLPGETTSTTVRLENEGGEPLLWQLSAGQLLTADPSLSPTIVLSEGFEAESFPPAGWTISNTTVTPTWTLADQPLRGSVAQGGQGNTPWLLEAWLETPWLSLTQGELTFWSAGSVTACRASGNSCDLNLWLLPEQGEPILIQKISEQWTADGLWVESDVSLAPPPAAGAVRLAFHYQGRGAAVWLDDVQLTLPAEVSPLCRAGGAVPWLTWTPAKGELAPGARISLSLGLAAAGLAEDSYSGTLCLTSNDPATPALPLPVTMTVDTCILEPAVAVPLTATATGEDLLLEWEPQPTNHSYEVHYRAHPFFQAENSSRIATLSGSESAYVDEGRVSQERAGFYRLRALNCADALPAEGDTAGFFSFPLRYAGSASDGRWNAIGTPLGSPHIRQAGDLLREIPDARVLMKWEAGAGWRSYDRSLPQALQDDFEIGPGDGLMVLLGKAAASTSTVALAGTVPAPGDLSSLLPGGAPCAYSLITLPLDQEQISSAGELVATFAPDNVRVVLSWDGAAARWRSYDSSLPASLRDDFPTQAGYPYFVCLAEAQQWP